MKLEYFGTDGIRGSYGSNLINEDFARILARALVRYQRGDISDPLRVVIGRDTRGSGATLANSATRAFLENGCEVIDLAVVPTPQVAFAVLHRQADIGVAITASHNPASDNGFKLFNNKGFKFTAAQESAIESHIRESKPDEKAGGDGDYIHDDGETSRTYIEKLLNRFRTLQLNGLKVAVDTANGATCNITPTVLEALGAQIVAIADQPDGHNINDGVGSEHAAVIQRLTRDQVCDFGIAHDGDGDRVIVVDDRSEVLSGEEFMAIIARHSLDYQAAFGKPLVTTVQSNFALDHYIRALGADTIRTPVGDRNVVYAMLKHRVNFGGENSGHYVFSDFLPCGDGLLATLNLLACMKKTGQKLSQLRKEFALFPSKLLNLKVVEKRPLKTLNHLQRTRDAIDKQLNGRGRTLLRYSGTENKIRILVEAETDTLVSEYIGQLREAARHDLEILE